MVSTIIHSVLPLFSHYGYRILFIAAFLESLLFVGVFVPGATLAVFAGFVARRHVLNFWPAFLVLSLGAYLGDILNYFLGKNAGYSFLKKYGKYFFFTEGRLETVRDHIRKNRAKTLILGRFTSFTRSISPFAAGASGVDLIPFFGFTLISAVSWAFSHLAIGYVFGKWLERISRHLGLIFFGAILLGFGLVYLYRFINSRHHIFKKLHVYTLVLMIFSLFIFSSTLQGILENDWLVSLNHYIASFTLAIQTIQLTEIMIFITNFAGGIYLTILSVLLAFYLIYKKDYYLASLTLFAIALGEVLQYILKAIINIPRPENGLVHTYLSAFPSGHSTAAMIFGAFLFLTFRKELKRRWSRVVLLIIISIGVLLVGFSRIYLNVHWATDVIAGFSLGLFCVTFSILFFRVVVFARKWFY